MIELVRTKFRSFKKTSCAHNTFKSSQLDKETNTNKNLNVPSFLVWLSTDSFVYGYVFQGA